MFQIMPLLACPYTHVCHMSMNKYGFYITNMLHTAIVLNRNTDPTFLYISTKIQPTATDTS